MFGTRTKDDVLSADSGLLSTLRQSYKDEVGNVDVSAAFYAKIGEKPTLCVTDGEHTARVTSDLICEAAQKVALTEERVRAQLEKTGGTAYKLTKLGVELGENCSLPASALNSLRRAAFEELDKKRANVHNYIINRIEPDKIIPYVPAAKRAVRARVTGTRLSEGFKKCEYVFVPLFADPLEIERLVREGYSVGVEIPRNVWARGSNRIAAFKAKGAGDKPRTMPQHRRALHGKRAWLQAARRLWIESCEYRGSAVG